MLMAVIGDVLGNFPALTAVWRAIQAEGIQTVIQAGDIVGPSSSAMAVINMLSSIELLGVQGERDRLLVRFLKKRDTLKKRLAPEAFDALAAAHAALSSVGLEFLRTRPRRLRFDADEITVLVCQGAVTGAGEQLAQDTPLVKFQRQREADPAGVIVCGGAPAPFSRLVDGTLFVGPGPIGAGRGMARYALVDTESDPWTASFPEVAFTTPPGVE